MAYGGHSMVAFLGTQEYVYFSSLVSWADISCVVFVNTAKEVKDLNSSLHVMLEAAYYVISYQAYLLKELYPGGHMTVVEWQFNKVENVLSHSSASGLCNLSQVTFSLWASFISSVK